MSPEERRKWTGGRRGGGFGNRFLVRLAKSPAGRLVAPVILSFIAAYFVVREPVARRASMDLARRVGRGDSILGRSLFAFSHFRTYAAMLFESLELLGGDEGFSIEREGVDELHRVHNGALGAVMVTAHFGNWEVMGQIFSSTGRGITLVMHDGTSESARRALRELSERRSFRIIYTDGSPAAAAAIVAAARRGETIGMMGDRLLGGRGVDVPFLGGRAEFAIGPYVVAALSGVPLFHVFSERIAPRRYAVRCHDEGILEYHDRRDREADHLRWASRYARRLEELVRRRPLQWSNFFAFWKDA